MRRNTFLLLQRWGNSAGEATMENSFLSASSKQLYSDSSFGKYVFRLLYLPFKTIIIAFALLTFSFSFICKTLVFARVLCSYFSLKWKFPALFFFRIFETCFRSRTHIVAVFVQLVHIQSSWNVFVLFSNFYSLFFTSFLFHSLLEFYSLITYSPSKS